MENEHNNRFYFVEDIEVEDHECGALISGGRKNSPTNGMTTDARNATVTAKLFLRKQNGEPIWDSESIINVNGTWWLCERHADEGEIKLR